MHGCWIETQMQILLLSKLNHYSCGSHLGCILEERSVSTKLHLGLIEAESLGIQPKHNLKKGI